MARFIITEMQHVLAVRVVEADTQEEAMEAFYEGAGVPGPRDGDITSSTVMSVETE